MHVLQQDPEGVSRGSTSLPRNAVTNTLALIGTDQASKGRSCPDCIVYCNAG